jgi:galactose-1-phosphate uridylyltransferase
MELVEQKLGGEYLAPDGRRKRYEALRRVDPISGRFVRLTAARPLENPEAGPLPDISERVEQTEGCVFCAGNVERKTPAFLPHVQPEGRFRLGRSILFPNLAPYGRHSAVCIFSEDHHVPLGAFPFELFRDALLNCLNYAAVVEKTDAESRFVAISQNVLPSSGGALLHPHLQVNIDPFPTTYHQLLLDREQEAVTTASPSFLRALALQEEHGPSRNRGADAAAAADPGLGGCLGERFVARLGSWSFFAAFAPLADWEVLGVDLESSRLEELRAGGLGFLVRGILAYQSFLVSQGQNAANLALFAATDGQHPLLLRLMRRAPYAPWYRSDCSSYEVALGEHATDMRPESLAASLRPFFA